MKFRMDFFIIAVAVIFLTIHTEQAFSQQVNTCQHHTICVHPGDMLKYSDTIGSANSSETYNFEDMIDSSHIRVVQQNQANGSEIKNFTMILNLKTGFAQSEQDSSITSPFLQILSTPMKYNKTDSSITQIFTDFNGFNRTALSAFHSTDNNTSNMVFDAETGILLEIKSASLITTGNTPQLVDFSSELTDTNIINSDSSGILSSNNVVTIPSWIKNNARYWHDGTIDDSTFAQGIQYMIKQGIITIPPTQSGQANPGIAIPAWIKNNAEYWASGDIDDGTFVKGIQYLITSGIIQV
jgi:hypothetical protein